MFTKKIKVYLVALLGVVALFSTALLGLLQFSRTSDSANALSNLLIVKKVKPDIARVSNHGGRIKTRKGSTIKFLIKYKNFLKKYAKEIWIDGGFRTPQHYNIAEYYGASCVLVGRPFVSDVLKQLS